MSEPRSITPDLATLATLFYASPDELGQFEDVTAADLPEPYQGLLAHTSHMTVTVEAFHHDQVDLTVLATNVSQSTYARKIPLTRASDGRVVQFGVMRVRLDHLDEVVSRDIAGERIPLGRVLISHGLLREVEVISLLHVTPGDELRELVSMEPGQTTDGRTALIHVDGEPIVQLIEIVTPC